MQLKANLTLADVYNALLIGNAPGGLVLGLHVQGIADLGTNDSAQFTSTAIPEPGSLAIWAMIAAGGAAAVARKRRGRWSKANREAILGVIQKA